MGKWLVRAGDVKVARAGLCSLAAVAMLATGCRQSADPVVVDPEASDPVTSDPVAVDAIAQQWAEREVYPNCGEVSLAMEGDLPLQGAKEIACMRRALNEARGAELSVTESTYEGDPIRVHYRLTPQGALELYEDSTDDVWSDHSWSFTECYRPDWLPGIACR